MVSTNRFLALVLVTLANSGSVTSVLAQEAKPVGVQGRVGCLKDPKKVERLEIKKPGVYENYLVDGKWGTGNRVKITADNVTLRNCEIFNCAGNGVGVFAKNVVIENCKIHHCLKGAFKDQQDAHGITGFWSNLTIRNCEIYYVSGDAVQFDPDRKSSGQVVIEDCTFWTGPLPADAAGFKKGERPGENAIDTKTPAKGERCVMLVRNCFFHGWNQPGQISNMAALNFKENVLVNVENCVLRDNEIAFRVRGPGQRGGANVGIKNCAIYDSAVGVRVEDKAENLKIDKLGFGKGVTRKYHIIKSGPGYENRGEHEAPPIDTLLKKGFRRPTGTQPEEECGAAAPSTETELSKLAASMKPGTWAELKTKDYGADLLKVQNHHILEYTDTAVWDPGSQQILFVGQGHYSAVKFITYSAATNSWKLMPTPAWWTGDPKTGKGPIGHAYQNNAIDTTRGLLFHHQSATRLVHQYDIAKSDWSTLPEIKGAATGHGTALAFFPERKGLVRVYGGTIHFWSGEKNAWSVLKDKVAMGPYHNVAKYNPVAKSVILGAGNGSKTLHRLDADGNLTTFKDAPFVIRISSTLTAVDPVTGDLLVVSMEDKKKFYALDVKKNAWRQLPDAPIAEGVTAPIAEHGVTMYFANKPDKAFLYKHSR